MGHDFGTGSPGDTVAPVQPQATQNRSAKLPHEPTPAYRLKAHPLRWGFFPPLEDGEEGEWLPILGKLVSSGGINNVDKTGDELAAKNSAEHRDWKVLDRNCVPPGTPNNDYLSAYPCAKGLYHCLVWETPRMLGGRVIESAVDERGYRAFLRWLIEERKIDPPISDAIRLHVELQRQKLAKIKGGSTQGDAARAEEKARLDQMVAADPGRKAKAKAAKPAKPKPDAE